MNKKVFASIVAVLIVGVLAISTIDFKSVSGNVTGNQPAPVSTFQTFTFFATSTYAYTGSTATTTTATSTNITSWFDSNGKKDSGYFVVAGAKKVQMYFTYDGSTTTPTGTAGFRVQGSPNGSDWYNFQKLVLSTSTTKTTVSEIFMTGATTTVPVSLDLTDDTWFAIRCLPRHVDSLRQNGQFSCKATGEF